MIRIHSLTRASYPTKLHIRNNVAKTKQADSLLLPIHTNRLAIRYQRNVLVPGELELTLSYGRMRQVTQVIGNEFAVDNGPGFGTSRDRIGNLSHHRRGVACRKNTWY